MALTKVTGQVINDTTGLVVGVTTVGGGVSATDGFFSGIVTAVGDASFSGNVSVGGTLTYEDVTNIDAVGLVTARNGIVVGSGITLSKDGDIFATGITTISENLKVGTGVTISPDGDGFFTGVVTATSFVGSGANLTGISQVSLSGSTDNTIVTVTGSNAIAGESTLTYDSGGMSITGDTDRDGYKITQSGNNYGEFMFNSNRSSADNALGIIRGEWNSSEVASIYLTAGDDTSNKDDGKIKFFTSAAGGSIANRMEVLNNGNVKVTDGDLVIGTSGHGIDFSATDNATGTSSSELFDDYEEGTWVPDARDGSLSYTTANYTKIGRMVYVSAYVNSFTDTSTNDQVTIQGLPFTIGVDGVTGGSVMYQYVSQTHACTVYIASTGLKFYGGHSSNYDGIRYNELNSSHSFYFHAWYIN